MTGQRLDGCLLLVRAQVMTGQREGHPGDWWWNGDKNNLWMLVAGAVDDDKDKLYMLSKPRQ